MKTVRPIAVGRKTTILFLALVMLLLAVVAAWPRISFFMLTGRFLPITRIQTLHAPITVKGWGPDGLFLADGRTVRLPGLRALPNGSPALAEATKRGIEIGTDARLYGLVRIHHWCGNDPVREHIARVDISDMMIFLRVGEPVSTVPEAEFRGREAGGRFSEWGWRIEEFSHFQSWRTFAEMAP